MSQSVCELSDQEKAFCYGYTSNGYDLTQAAFDAGLSKKAAKKLLNLLPAKSFIADIQRQHHRNNLITRHYIESQYLDLIPKLRGEEEVPMVCDGIQVKAKKFHATELVSVLRDLYKAAGIVDDERDKKDPVSEFMSAVLEVSSKLHNKDETNV